MVIDGDGAQIVLPNGKARDVVVHLDENRVIIGPQSILDLIANRAIEVVDLRSNHLPSQTAATATPEQPAVEADPEVVGKKPAPRKKPTIEQPAAPVGGLLDLPSDSETQNAE